MNERYRPLTCCFALAILAAFSSDGTALARHKQMQHDKKAHAASKPGHQRQVAREKGKHAKDKHAAHAAAAHKPTPAGDEPPAAAPQLSGDLAAVKQGIELARKSDFGGASAIEKTIDDPAGRKLVEWFLLRHPDSNANFSRYAAFIADNPGWPSMSPMR